MTWLKRTAVTFFGLGYLPGVPGTWGSAGAVAVFVALARGVGQDRLGEVWLATFLLALAAAGVGMALGGWAERQFGRKDPPTFVLDEVAGMWLALCLVPVRPSSLLYVAAGQFLLFRLMDIVKPFPIRRLEKLAGGLGIVLDDVVAGIYANVAGQLLFRVALHALTKAA